MKHFDELDTLKLAFLGEFISNYHLQLFLGNRENLYPKGTGRYMMAQRKIKKCIKAGYLMECKVIGYDTSRKAAQRYYVRTKQASLYDLLPYDTNNINRKRHYGRYLHDHLRNDWLFALYNKFHRQHGLSFDFLPEVVFRLPDGTMTKEPDSAVIIDGKYCFLLEVERSRDENAINKAKLIPYSRIKDLTPYRNCGSVKKPDYQPVTDVISNKMKILVVIAHGDNKHVFTRPWEFPLEKPVGFSEKEMETWQEKQRNEILLHKITTKFPSSGRFLYATAHNFADCDKAIWTRDGVNWEKLIPRIG